MHRDGGVSQHGLGAGGGDGDVARAVRQRIAEVPELPLDLLLLRLLVGERGEAAGAPVDDVVAPVDEPLLVEPDEGLAHGPGHPAVEGEVGAGPVAARAESLELIEDGAPGVGHVLPDPLDERLPAEVEAGLPLLGEEPLDHVLGGDAGVVGARDPERAAAPHPLEPDQDVLDGVVEPVTHVEHGGHVGRGHDDDVGDRRGGAPVGLHGEEPPPGPPPVEVRFDQGRVVVGRERLGHALWSVAR